MTGAAGFVGANLARALLDRFKQLHVIIKPSTNPWRIKNILKHVNVHGADLIDRVKIRRILKDLRPDIVFHLAAHGGYPHQSEFEQVMNGTVISTVNLLEGLKEIDFESFIHAGSSSEYGFKAKPMKETDGLNPAFLYAAAKGSSSLICQGFAKVFKKPVVTLRLFSVYGPWEEPTRLIPTVVTSILKGRPVFMTSGKQVRDFVFVDDVVNACLKTCSKQNIGGEIFNIGTGEEITIEKVINRIVDLIGITVEIHKNRYPSRMWDTTHWKADISKAKRVLKWESRYDINQGLKKTIEWFRNNLNLYP